MRRRRLLGWVTAAVLLVIGTISAAQNSAAQAHTPAERAVAEQHGYAVLTGTSGIPCIDIPGSNLQDMLDLYALKRQLAALRREQPIR
jgi:hypothetical protein